MDSTPEALMERLALPRAVHPEHAACAAHAEAWAERYGALDGGAPARKVKAWDFSFLAAAMLPRATLADICLVADFTNWIAVVDDLVESQPDRAAALKASHLAKEDAPGSGLLAAWADLRRRMAPPGEADFSARLREALEGLFAAYEWEGEFRRSGKIPILSDFREHRHASGGLPLYLLILERAAGGPLPQGLARAPWRRSLDAQIGTLTCWANDLFSFDWDRDSDNPINLVRVVQAQEKCGVDEAVAKAFALFEEGWEAWRAQSTAPGARDPAVERYVSWQPYLVSGTLAWMTRTRRYAEQTGAAKG